MTEPTQEFVAYDPNTTPHANNIASPLSTAFPQHRIVVRTEQTNSIDRQNAYTSNTIIVQAIPRNIANITDTMTVRLGNFTHASTDHRMTPIYMYRIPAGGMTEFPYIGVPSARQQNSRHPYYMAYVGFHSNGGINIYINIQDQNQWERISPQMINSWAQDIKDMISPKRLSDNIDQVHQTFMRVCEKIEEGKQQEAKTRVHQKELGLLHAGTHTQNQHIAYQANEALKSIIENNIENSKQHIRNNISAILQMDNVKSIEQIYSIGGQTQLLIQLTNIYPKGEHNPENIVYNDLYAIMNLDNNTIQLTQPKNSPNPYKGCESNPNIHSVMWQYNQSTEHSNIEWMGIPNIDLLVATQELMLQHEYARALTRHIRYLTRANPYNPYFQSTT